jgi:heptosyltransferase III
MHAADFFLRQAGCDGPAVPRIECASTVRGDFGVIHPFSGSQGKNWPLHRFRELAQRLPFPVQWSAGPEERLEDAVRMDSLWDLACWLATARIYIGNDSGVTHLAAAVGTPVVAIFGPTDPAVWAPRGDRVQVVHGKLEEITVDQVLAAMDKLLPCGPRRRNS